MNINIRKYLPVLTGSLIFSLLILLTTMPAFAADSASATRDIQTITLAPGESTNVTVTITNTVDQALSLKENIPSGWTLTRGTDDANSYKSSTHEWVWFSATAGDTKTVTYTLAVPSDAALAEYTLTGTISNASESFNVSGESTITVSNATPALTITAVPAEITVNTPTSVTFTVTSEGTPVEADVLLDGIRVGTTNATTGILVRPLPGIPSPRTINVIAEKTGYTNGTATISIVAAPAALSITAVPAEITVNTPTEVTFTVTSDGTPVDAVAVIAQGLGTLGTTNATGQLVVNVPGIPSPVIINITAYKLPYTNGTTAIRVVETQLQNLSIVADIGEVTVGIPTNVTFTVTSQGTPVPLVLVSLSGMANGSDRTDANGTAIITVDATGAGLITATASRTGYNDGTTTITAVVPAVPLSIVADLGEVTVGIPTNVTFTVTSDGAPVRLVLVSLGGMANGSDRTDANGTAIINVNATGEGVITATASRTGYIDGTTTIIAVAPPASRSATIGLYHTGAGVFFLKNSNSAGAADEIVQYGPGGSEFVPVVGDYDGSGDATIGVYHTSTGTFFLKNSNSPGAADTVVQYGPGGSDFVPIVGDWNGDGTKTVGVYQTSTGIFFLKNTNSAGNADVTVQYGPGGSGLVPVVGDWDGSGNDTIGLYHTGAGVFFLSNSNLAGAADVIVQYGPGGSELVPVVGDYNGDGTATVGLYHTGAGAFFLKNSNSAGAADVVVQYGPGGSGFTPVIGDWS